MSENSKKRPSGVIVFDSFCSDYSPQFFRCSQNGIPTIGFIQNGKTEYMRVNEGEFKGFAYELFHKVGEVPLKHSVEMFISLATGRCHVSREKKDLKIRVARKGHSCIYIDMGTNAREYIKISAKGHVIVGKSPFAFFRPPNQLPLPTPVPCSLEEYRDLAQALFAGSEQYDWLHSIVWQVSTVLSYGSFVILLIVGPKGSGKTTLTLRNKLMIDPSTDMLLSRPRNEEVFATNANNALITAYDNSRRQSAVISDLLCQSATGGTFSSRMLYENGRQFSTSVQHPVIINGIGNVSDQSDFIDRCVRIDCEKIAANFRRDELEMQNEFMEARPKLLDGLCQLVSGCIREWDNTQIKGPKPRMTVFGKTGVIVEKLLNLPEGIFLENYWENIKAQSKHNFWDEGLCTAIYEKLHSGGPSFLKKPLEGTSSQLMRLLGCGSRAKSYLPNSPRAFSEQLSRLESDLNSMGIVIERPPRTSSERKIIIRLADSAEHESEVDNDIMDL